MTEEEHKQRHLELHHSFDELFADWLRHHPGRMGNSLETPVRELMEWSWQQCQHPIMPPESSLPSKVEVLCDGCGHAWADHLPLDVVGCQHLTPIYSEGRLRRHDRCECKKHAPYDKPVRGLG